MQMVPQNPKTPDESNQELIFNLFSLNRL